MITAPYNFVPLNKEIFYPSWADDVSHDVPFEDGESGEIDITITAKSPIFIRDSKNEQEFFQHNSEYYIPSSSVKGMVRNVLEIMSFSKMRLETFDDDTYAVRDLRNPTLYMNNMKPNIISCGWLKLDTDNNYIIEDCGTTGRIKHEEIDKIFNINFSSKFKSGIFADKPEVKTAKYKYKMLENKHLVHNFTYSNKDMANREIYIYDKNSMKKGTIVLTGQPSGRKEPQNGKASGKIYEFIFFDVKSEIKVSKEVMNNFKFAYFDKRTTEPKESHDWTYWKKKLENGEKVPVFFQKDNNGIKHFGLSYLYKLSYSHSIKDGIPKTHFESDDLDLSQTIFGYISKNNNEALKGRVQFSHFKAVSNVIPLEPRKEILGTPRASYYPIYVKQQDGKLYSTFMDDDFEIAGRKRYPIHNSNQTMKTTDTGNEKVGTTFTPLKDGVIFKGKLRFHNLKKCEIGAILSALTFHNTPKTFHNIGMAKSLGYGKVELKIDGIEDISSYLKEFELVIGEQIANWSKSEQLQELISMAIEQQNSGSSILKYMELSEFAKNKNRDQEDYLAIYTSLSGIKKVNLKSFLTENENKDLLSKREALKEELKKKVEEEKAKKIEKEALERKIQTELAEQEAKLKKQNNDLEKALSSNDIQTIKNFILKYPNNENISHLQDIQNTLEEAQQQNKFSELNHEVQKAWDNIHNPQYKSKLKGALDSFIKKWEAEKNNKNSEFVLNLVQNAKNEFKKLK